MSSQLILIVEENASTRAFLAEQLEADGYEVVLADSRRHALALLASHRPALVLADINGHTLGLLDAVRGGEGLAGEIDPDTPMIVLTSRADELARVRVFERGGDDVLSKPFSYPELRGRIRALLRRAHERPPARVSRAGALTVNHLTREVRVGERVVELTAREYELLRTLIADPTRVFTREELLRDVWGLGVQARTRTLDSHAFRLRQKLAAGEPGRAAGDQRVGRRLPPDGQRGGAVSAPDQVTDLYRELAIHRVQDAIDKLGANAERPARRPDRRGARGGRWSARVHHGRVRHPGRPAGRALPPADQTT